MKKLSKKKKFLACTIAVLVGFATGTAVRAGTVTYTAFCNTTHYLGGSWWGNDHTDRKDAEAEAEAHRKDFPGHKPEIFER